MKKLCSPITIIILIIVTIINTILSIVAIVSNSSINKSDELESDKPATSLIVESSSVPEDDNISFTIFDTSMFSQYLYEHNQLNEWGYAYNMSKQDNFERFMREIYDCPITMVYNIQCESESARLNSYTYSLIPQDDNTCKHGYPESNIKLYDENISTELKTLFNNNLKELTVDDCINTRKDENGQLIMSYTILPTYVAIEKIGHGYCCYEVGDELVEYIQKLS